MPIINSVMRMYKEIPESVYFNRFLDVVIGKRFNSVDFNINGYRARMYITGVLYDDKGKKFFSLVEFYNHVTGENMEEHDETVFHHLFVTKSYNINRILNAVTEDEVLDFCDQKYRSFCMYRDLKMRIKHYTKKNVPENVDSIQVMWNNRSHDVTISNVTCKSGATNPFLAYQLMNAYESGSITDLYYIHPSTKKCHLICS
jgi:hypothetical protein